MTTDRLIWFGLVTLVTSPLLLAVFKAESGITSAVILQSVGLAALIGVGCAMLFGKSSS